MRRTTVVLVVALLVAACAEGSPPGPPTEMSVSSRIYLQNLLNIMENNALGRHETDWPTFRAEVVAAGGTAQTVGELIPAIRRALELLGNGHSTFYPMGGGLALRGCSAAVTPLPSDIGYKLVPDEGTAIAELTVQRAVDWLRAPAAGTRG
jgi:hypothetical protein